MSPTNLSTVPPFRKTMSTMRVKYSFSCRTSSSGFPFSVMRGKTAQVREEHRHLAPRAAELGELGLRHQLLVDVAGDVAAEQPADFPLLGILDEVAIRGAGEERHAAGQERLRHARATCPRSNAHDVPPVQAAASSAEPSGCHPERQERRTSDPIGRSRPRARAATPVQRGAGARNRFDRMLSATLACSWMPRIEPFAERRLKDVDAGPRTRCRRTRSCL